MLALNYLLSLIFKFDENGKFTINTIDETCTVKFGELNWLDGGYFNEVEKFILLTRETGKDKVWHLTSFEY